MSDLLENTAPGAEIVSFGFEGHEVRLVEHDGISWWVAADVCDVLEIVNNRDAISRLDEDELMSVIVDVRSKNGVKQRRKVNVINESGLYSLILTSRKPEARRFKKWLTSEVLPAIRRTGRYESRKEEAVRVLPPPPPAFTPEIMQSMMQGMVTSVMKNIMPQMLNLALEARTTIAPAPEPAPQKPETQNLEQKPRKYHPDSSAARASRENGKKGGRPRKTPEQRAREQAERDYRELSLEKEMAIRRELGFGDARDSPGEHEYRFNYYTMEEAAEKLGVPLREFVFTLHHEPFAWFRMAAKTGFGFPRAHVLSYGWMVNEGNDFFITVRGLVYLEKRLFLFRKGI